MTTINFEQVWAEYEKKGFQYGGGALENVKFGFRIAIDALASAPVAPQACQSDVCQAGKADGVLCANDECDRANGVRPASAPVADERQLDGKRPDLDWIEEVCVTDTVGRGWCVRIDGTDIFEEVNRYGCKGRKSFQIASGLPSKQEAERAALEWLDRQRASLASDPVAGPIQWPTMPPSKGQSPVLFEDGYAEGWAKCMDECQRAVSAASTPVAGKAQPAAWANEDGEPISDALKQARPDLYSKHYSRPLVYAAPQASEAVRDGSNFPDIRSSSHTHGPITPVYGPDGVSIFAQIVVTSDEYGKRTWMRKKKAESWMGWTVIDAE